MSDRELDNVPVEQGSRFLIFVAPRGWQHGAWSDAAFAARPDRLHFDSGLKQAKFVPKTIVGLWCGVDESDRQNLLITAPPSAHV
jgi:hypothetical protein